MKNGESMFINSPTSQNMQLVAKSTSNIF